MRDEDGNKTDEKSEADLISIKISKVCSCCLMMSEPAHPVFWCKELFTFFTVLIFCNSEKLSILIAYADVHFTPG